MRNNKQNWSALSGDVEFLERGLLFAAILVFFAALAFQEGRSLRAVQNRFLSQMPKTLLLAE